MKTAFIGFIVFVWVILAVLIVVWADDSLANSTMVVAGNTTTVADSINVITSFNILEWTELFGVIPIPMFNMYYFETFLTMASWDFAFFSGTMEYVRWIIFMPITAMFVFGIMILLISLIQGAVG